VKQRRFARLGDGLIERVSIAIIGVEPLHRRVKFKALNAVIFDQIAGFTRAQFALGRINRGKGDEDVGMLGRGRRDLVIVVAAVAGFALGIDRENHRCDVHLAVMRGSLINRRRMRPGRTKIGRHRGLKIIVTVIMMTATGLFGMGVKINRADRGKIDHVQFLIPGSMRGLHCRTSAPKARHDG